MRMTIRALVAMGWAAGLSVCAALPALGDPTLKTVSDYYGAMIAVAGRLDTQVSDRQKAADMAAAQRVALVAAMVRRSAEEFRGAEQDSMLEDVGGLPAPIPERAKAALEEAKQAELAAADHPDFVDEAHKTFNALVGVLPLKPPHPIVYGMLSNDLVEPAAPLPGDIVFYGYRLIDPEYKQPPTIFYGKQELPAASIAVVKDVKINVTLPDDVKAAVHFAPPPCLSRGSFGLRVQESWAEHRGIWPIRWSSEMKTNADFYALPTPVVYTATIVASSETATIKTMLPTFDQRSSLVIADCSETKSVDLEVPLPDGAQDSVCSAGWADTTGAVKLSSQCRIENGKAHAVGSISGGSKACSPDKLCTCTAPAQGWLEIRGSYRLEEIGAAMQSGGGGTPVSFPSGGFAEARIAVKEGEKLRHVALTISRRACPTVLDTIDLSIGDDPEGEAGGVSRTGAFRASIRGAELKVGAADAFALDAHNTP